MIFQTANNTGGDGGALKAPLYSRTPLYQSSPNHACAFTMCFSHVLISSIKWNVICFHIISQIQRFIAVSQNIDKTSKMDQSYRWSANSWL